MMHQGNPFAWTKCGHPTQPTECHVCEINRLRAALGEIVRVYKEPVAPVAQTLYEIAQKALEDADVKHA